MYHPEPKLPGSHGPEIFTSEAEIRCLMDFLMLRMDPGASLGS